MTTAKIASRFRFATAALAAFATFIFIGHFHLLEFDHAPLLAAGVVGISYELLARQYERSLHAIFFSLGLVIAYKAFTLKSRDPIKVNPTEQILNHLAIHVALTLEHATRTGKLPQTGSDPLFLTFPKSDSDAKIIYCLVPCPFATPTTPNLSHFWLQYSAKNSRDKAHPLWYIDDYFAVYHRDPTTTSFHPYPGEKF